MEKGLHETEPLKADPLARLLHFIQGYIDMMSDLKETHPGCLYASYVYEPNYFGEEIKGYIADSIVLWRNTFEVLLGSVLDEYRPNREVDVASMADLFTVIFEGSLIVSKALDETDVTARQLKHLKTYFETVFEVRSE